MKLPAITDITVVRFEKREETVGETLLSMKFTRKNATVEESMPRYNAPTTTAGWNVNAKCPVAILRKKKKRNPVSIIKNVISTGVNSKDNFLEKILYSAAEKTAPSTNNFPSSAPCSKPPPLTIRNTPKKLRNAKRSWYHLILSFNNTGLKIVMTIGIRAINIPASEDVET